MSGDSLRVMMALGFSHVTSVASGSGASSRVQPSSNASRLLKLETAGRVGRGAAPAPELGGQDALGDRLGAVARVRGRGAGLGRVHGRVP